MHMICVKIAEYSIRKQWINEQDKLWCIYALEKKLLTLLFFLSLLPFGLFFHSLDSISIFSILFLLLRRRFGGWHAPTIFLCQIIGIVIVLLAIQIIGPRIIIIEKHFLFFLNGCVMFIALITKPVFPEQVHFNEDAVIENNSRKNKILLSIFLLQITIGRFFLTFLVNSFMAVLFCLLLVCVEKKRQKNKESGEYS